MGLRSWTLTSSLCSQHRLCYEHAMTWTQLRNASSRMAAARVRMASTPSESPAFADTYREWIESVRDFQACTRPEDILVLLAALDSTCDHQPTDVERDALDLLLDDAEDSGLGEFVFTVRMYLQRLNIQL